MHVCICIRMYVRVCVRVRLRACSIVYSCVCVCHVMCVHTVLSCFTVYVVVLTMRIFFKCLETEHVNQHFCSVLDDRLK